MVIVLGNGLSPGQQYIYLYIKGPALGRHCTFAFLVGNLRPDLHECQWQTFPICAQQTGNLNFKTRNRT